MRHNKSVTMKSPFWMPLRFTILAILSLIFCTPKIISSAEKYYYYLHISSFRLEKRAVKNVETIRNQGYDAVTRREQLPNTEYWYRVYVGPFSSLEEAMSKKKELIRLKLTDYGAIKKTDYLIKSEIEKPPEEEKKVLLESKKEIPIVGPAQELTLPPIQEPDKVRPTFEKPPEEKEIRKVGLPEKTPATPEELREAPPAPLGFPERTDAKPPSKNGEISPKGNGRNMDRGNFSMGLRHTYREVPLELTKRTRISSNSTTTTIEDLSVTNGENCFTRLHMDSLRTRFGLTNYLEIFAEIDGAYLELSDLGFTYGGGLRLNLFQVKGGRFRGFYSALQGEYLSGQVEYEYSSTVDDKWKKKIDWEEFIAKGELGFAWHRFSAYMGAAYFDYHEDTERELLENLPPALTSFVLQDELEEKESIGAFGGISINLSSAFLLNIEGQAITQKSVFVTLEYHFQDIREIAASFLKIHRRDLHTSDPVP